jgi:SAM-dependent methyltransferase
MTRLSHDNHDAEGDEPESSRLAVTSKDSLPVLAPHELFARLFLDYPHTVARDVSRQERKANEYVSLSLVYGEIAFDPFRAVLDQLKRTHLALTTPGGIFLDIGSGSGKAVFAAALAHDFDACYGIEILDGLCEISQKVLHDWERNIKKQYALPYQKRRTRIHFTLGDALEEDWPTAPSADLVFMNSTCFSASLLRELTRKLASYCKSGAMVITATHALPDTQSFEELRSLTVEQEAWGNATWYLHRRK